MGTRPRLKSTANGSGEPKADKKKGLWIVRMVRKRKLRSLSEERLHDSGPNFRTSEEGTCTVAMEDPREPRNKPDDIGDEAISRDMDHHGGDTKLNGATDNARVEKKAMFSSAIKFLKKSFKSTKRQKRNDYSKFSDSTDNLVESTPSTSGGGVKSPEREKDRSESITNEERTEEQRARRGKKYVRFDTRQEEDKENLGMTIDEYMVSEKPSSSSTNKTTTTTPKKKKSARKRVAKAGKKTGRIFSVGMVHIGRNLQYLTPIPTAHIFEEVKSKSDYGTSSSYKPKKKNYKYTASVPPTNPYAFI